LWGNTAAQDSQIHVLNGDVVVEYSDVQDSWMGEGNIDVDPFFVDPLNSDFHLQDISQCIGAGIDSIEINGIWYYAPLFDIDGEPRPNPPECMPDIGAQESLLCSTATTISINPTILNFGKIAVDSFATKVFTITNTGNAVLEVTDISSNEPAFTVNRDSTTILPGNDQDVEVTFTPTEGSVYIGIIEIIHNAVGSLDSVSVMGNGIPTGIEDEMTLPVSYKLYQNYPNPFNPVTMIRYSLPERSNVSLKIFNPLGEEIELLVDESKEAGSYEAVWSAEGLPSGIYLYGLQAGKFVETKKMVLMK
jgi:hypothetical protein